MRSIYVLSISYLSGVSRRRFYAKAETARKVAERHQQIGNEVSLEVLSCVPLGKQLHPALKDWSRSTGIEVTTGGN